MWVYGTILGTFNLLLVGIVFVICDLILCLYSKEIARMRFIVTSECAELSSLGYATEARFMFTGKRFDTTS